jgi:glycosyltransferase involved in cell wall biosynthesis
MVPEGELESRSAVAVVIPSYNHAKFIGAALESVAGQTLAPSRIVVVDDGSSDGSVELIRGIGDPRIDLLEQENAGAHHALNRAIQAVGDVDYIAILNSDDLYEPERLERCVAFLEKNKGLCDVVCTGVQLIDLQGAALPSDNPKVRRLDDVWLNPQRDPAEWLGVSNFLKTSSNFVIRAEYARSHPFRSYRYAHDYFFAVVAAVHGRLAVLPEPLLRYRIHTSNTIKSDGAARVAQEVVRLNLDLLLELAGPLSQSETLRAAYTRYFRNLADNHSDFRAEVFLSMLAQLVARLPVGERDCLFGTFKLEDYPELAAPSSREMRTGADQHRLDNLRKTAAQSRWIALGIALGFAPKLVSKEESQPGKELSRLQKGLERSPWVWLGRVLGFSKLDSVEA